VAVINGEAMNAISGVMASPLTSTTDRTKTTLRLVHQVVLIDG
jgi:hypothetical protein